MKSLFTKNRRGQYAFPEDREKFGTEFMDKLEDSAVGRFFDLSGERQQVIDQASREGKLGKVSKFTQKIEDKVGQTVAPVLKPVGAALGKISDVTQIDERISTPLTFVAAGAAAKGISKIKPKHLGITQTIEPYTPPKGLGKTPRKMVNITDDIIDAPRPSARDIARVAKKNKISYQQAKEFLDLELTGTRPKGTLKPGSSRLSRGYKKGGLFDPNRDDTIMYSSTPNQPRPKLPPKVTTNEKIKKALLNDEAIILNPTYRGGKITVRNEADFFDVSAALIGPGQETKKDAKGRKIPYDRRGVTEFGGKKSDQRTKIYNHIKSKLKKSVHITREEFDKYADEQVAAEKDLRKAIKLLNLRSYAAAKNIDLSQYPTKESQLQFLNEINKAKRNKTGYLDYKETFDYGHIISAKTGFRIEDLGLNRISNTEIETAHNIVSRDPYTQRIIDILQEGNRERGSRRDFIPVVQMLRNSAGSVVEDFVKWKSRQYLYGPKEKDDIGSITKILDKFLPRDQHDNYLKFIQKRFYERRKLSGSLKTYVENELGIPYSEFKKMNNRLQLKVRRMYEQDIKESGNVIGRQQYDQAEMWMRDAIDEFIGLHHFSTPKKLRTTKDMEDLNKIGENLPRNIDTLLDMILPTDE